MIQHARIQKVLPEGSNSDKVVFWFVCLFVVVFLFFFFFSFFFWGGGGVIRWERNQIALKKRAIIAMAFRWRADYGPTLNASLVAL